ncbi:hypothetical protein MJO28_008365, partial [Puccinia striiformis f. sp. tritici]
YTELRCSRKEQPASNGFSTLRSSIDQNLISSWAETAPDTFKLLLGVLLTDVPVTYHTWGKLNAKGTNCMVICHLLTGSADVKDWWGLLVGPGLVFDLTLYFIFCANTRGSPYGCASPVPINPKTEKWGPEFPSTKMRDDVNL